MITVEIPDRTSAQVNPSLVENAVKATLAHLSVPDDSSLTVVITDDQTIHDLNLRFRKIDAPTDVLSFPAGYADPESGSTYLGDVIISYPQAVIQAEQRVHPVIHEIQLLVIHGTLHLLGYDHAESSQKARMWALQSEILAQLGVDSDALGDL